MSDATLQQAAAHFKSGEFASALEILEAVCAASPTSADAWFLLGASAHHLGKLDRALDGFDCARHLNPSHINAALGAVVVLIQRGEAARALGRCEELAARFPREVPVWLHAGTAWDALGRDAAAVTCYDRALALDPGSLAAGMNRGAALARMGLLQQAVDNNAELVSRHPGSADAHYNVAHVSLALDRYAEALAHAQRALSLSPEHGRARLDLGLALAMLQRFGEAAENLQRAVALNDPAVAAQIAGWQANTDEPLQLNPREIWLARSLLAIQRCDWSQRAQLVSVATEWITNDPELTAAAAVTGDGPAQPIASRMLPFELGSLGVAPELLLKLSRNVASRIESHAAPLRRPARIAHPPTRKTIRLGFMSANLYEHPTAQLSCAMYKLIDRSRFEVLVYSLGRDDGGQLRRRIMDGSDRFIDLYGKGPEAIAAAIARDGVDLLIDLNGYSRGAKAETLALRPAPVQIEFLAYAGTTGARFIDYMITDAIVVPPGSETLYSEAVVRLPSCYLINDYLGLPDPAPPPRGSLGLPEDAFVFCCFNQHYKISPVFFDTWMQLLRKVPGSVLWLLDGQGRDNLQRAASAAGIDPDRLRFAPLLGREAHLSRLAAADLFLDTLHYGAHTTGADALWAGVPMLTLPDRHLASRVGASLLAALGIPELIVPDLEHYAGLACSLANDRKRLGALRARLASARRQQPLFDTPRTVAALERGFELIWARHCASLPPAHIDVPDAGAGSIQ